MRKRFRAIPAFVLSILMLVMVFSGGALASGSQGLITLDFLTYVSGAHNAAAIYQAMVDRFNAKYDGQYKVVIQPIVQADYDDKIKQLATANALPTLMYTMDTPQWLLDYVVPNKISYDFGPWLNEHPDIKNRLIPASLQFCTDKDGRVWTLPMLTTSPIGLFYNPAVFNPEKPIGDMTLEEFEKALDDAGQKVAFMTGDNAWGTMLFYSALINAEPGGLEMMKQYGGISGVYCTDFSGDIWLNATTKFQQFLQKYATSNTIGAEFSDAQNVFMNNGAACIMNGPWMFGQFDPNNKDSVANWGPGFDGANVKAAAYPGNLFLGLDYRIGQYWIADSASADQKECALAFLDFVYSPEEFEMRLLAEGNWCPTYTPSADFWAKAAEKPLLQSYLASFNDKTQTGQRFDEIVYSSVAKPVFPNLLPDLITGKLTPQGFLDALTKASLEAKAQAAN